MPLKSKSNQTESYPTLEFHLRAALENELSLQLPMFSLQKGQFRIEYNEVQKLALTLDQTDQGGNASELHGLGLLNLISHKIIRLYRNQINPTYIEDLGLFLEEKLTTEGFKALLSEFLESLPSDSLVKSDLSTLQFLESNTDSIPNSQIVTEELLVHLLALNNPAFGKYSIIFKENFHPAVSDSAKLLKTIEEWSRKSEGFGANKMNIIDVLLEPVTAAPGSIEAQLAFISENWANYMGSHLGDLLRGLDHFSEENRFRGAGPGESQIPNYSGDLLEGEFFSEDSDWMPRVVMIARNSLVWLDQLSKKYDQQIVTLRDIPDQELDLLAKQGFNVLWLIGLWHRSVVSKKIKHWCGNPDAESSAYSLKEYSIDPSIGGPEALDNLRARAWERGIRLASDMVPNHTGLDSEWLKDHPDWYISTSHPPFPAYQFEGGNLSEDPEIGIQLEDHYYDRSDASVVFKHEDHRSGEIRYVYHGNDGTSMPWNDTAQLNYLNPELREEIIQTILGVARQFKVIRFDAAMTLAKRHIQRLWYPEPGRGGDIPSRSNYSMTGSDFNQAIPMEFWREVVDRVAKEVPDTLLLAEAFWMMEGYFVRTLGMHRVYNSAFMNMLKMEENSKFFEMIATTLEFDPRILQRFVNFLSNPDEDTAIAQFGKGDKYFGATILMVTLPGLPMFAHAQIEGFEEKYGMEYRRAYWDEKPDENLILRHETQIYPLMKKRYLFAGANNFRLFPMYTPEGHGVKSVFAYTNRNGTERSLILVNNSYESQAGWVKTSTPFNQNPTAEEANLVTEDIIFALSFDVENDFFIIFQEQLSKLWYIRTVAEVRDQGLYMELSGYESQVYLNFQLVSDTQTNPWSTVYGELVGNGINDFAPLFRSIELEPVKILFSNLINFLITSDETQRKTDLFPRFAPLFEAILEIDNISLLLEEIEDSASKFSLALESRIVASKDNSSSRLEDTICLNAILCFAAQLRIVNQTAGRSMVLDYELEDAIQVLTSEMDVENVAGLAIILELVASSKTSSEKGSVELFKDLFEHDSVRVYFNIHEIEGDIWFKKEAMDQFLKYSKMFFPEFMDQSRIAHVSHAVNLSKYEFNAFLELLEK